MTTITLTLPERTMEQAQQAAAALQRPVEDVLRDLLAAVLPTMHDVPNDMRAELMRMTWLDSQELWRMAREQMSASGTSTVAAANAFARAIPAHPRRARATGRLAPGIWPYDPLESACLRSTQSARGRTPPQSGLAPRHGVYLPSYSRQDRVCRALPL